MLVGIMLCPRTYQSEAKLFVRVGRESVTLDPTVTTGQTISVHESRENELNSVLDVLSSRVLLEEVVDRLGPQVILFGGPIPPASKAPAERPAADAAAPPERGLLAAIGLSDPFGEREKAVLALAKAVNVSAGKKSAVIALTCRADSPELARRILTELIAAFREKHLEVNHTEGTLEFFVGQAEEAKQAFDAAAAELTDARNALGVATVEARRTTLQAQIAALETDLLDTRKSLAAVEASVATTRKSMAALPATVLAQQTAGSPNSAADQTRRTLADLRLREQALLARYTESHPLVVSVRDQAARAEQMLDSLGRQSLQETNSPNPALQALEVRLLGDEAQAESLRARERTVAGQLAETRTALEELNRHEGRLAVLEQRRDVAAASYRDYATRLEQARLDRELDREQIMNVNVYQKPTYVAKPVKPDKRLIFMAGVVFAAAGAVGLALALEYSPALYAGLRRQGPSSAPFGDVSSGPETVPPHDRRRPALTEA